MREAEAELRAEGWQGAPGEHGSAPPAPPGNQGEIKGSLLGAAGPRREGAGGGAAVHAPVGPAAGKHWQRTL